MTFTSCMTHRWLCWLSRFSKTRVFGFPGSIGLYLGGGGVCFILSNCSFFRLFWGSKIEIMAKNLFRPKLFCLRIVQFTQRSCIGQFSKFQFPHQVILSETYLKFDCFLSCILEQKPKWRSVTVCTLLWTIK